MITLNKIKIFRKFNGDIDGWARIGTNKSEMTDKDWYDIQNLLQKIFMMKNGLTSSSFNYEITKELNEKTDSEETRKLILSLDQTIKHDK